MCPACFANLALFVTAFVSTSSIAAGAIKLIRHRKTSAKLLEVQKKDPSQIWKFSIEEENRNEYRQQSAE
jgi:hypothetical protein